MTKTIKFLAGVAVAAFTLATTSCIDETMPTNGITQDQLDKSQNTVSGLLMSLPKRMNAMDARSGNFGDYAIGYGGLMIIRDTETGDFLRPASDYDHFQSFATTEMMGDQYAVTQWLWNYSYQNILAANTLLRAAKSAEAAGDNSNLNKLARAEGYAFRAFYYLDAARSFEFLPNDKFSGANSDGNNVTNLTVPIVTEETTEEQAKNNPRATRDVMAKFILQDLDSAESLVPVIDETSYKGDKTLANLAVVYGLKARLYMWLEDYTNAAKYAQQSINAAGGLSESTVMTYQKCLVIDGNKIAGYQPTCFNQLSDFMWGVQQTSEDATVKSGILNWTSWMSPSAGFSAYAAAGATPCMDMSMINRMFSGDWRQVFYDATNAAAPGVGYKFQPVGGSSETNYLNGAASAYPLMRIEEMFFIQCEALAHSNPTAAKALLEQFMNEYRNISSGKYVCTATSKEGIIEEIVYQKRVELWGEGQTFFDIKRLNYSVTRGYKGTNHQNEARFNTNGRPAWMNWVMVQTEQNNNQALKGWNNPDPTRAYPVWME